MKQILVTGGTGFVGAYIIRQLVTEGYAVHAIKRKESRLPFFIDAAILNKINWIEADLLDIGSLEDAMTGMDAIIHAAAIVSFHKEDRKEMYLSNVNGTANIVNVALEKGVKKIIYISSVAALGRSEQDDVVNEKKAWTHNRINTHYAISKQKAELEVWRGMAEGLEGIILNPSTVLGYGDWNNSSAAIFKNVYEEFPWFTRGINGFVYVEDLAKIAVSFLQQETTMERYIVSAENWSFLQLLSSIAKGFGKKPPHREASRFMGQIAWRFEKLRSFFTGKKPLLSRDSAKVAQSRTYFDNSKILDALPGFHFTPLEKAIQFSCSMYLQKHSV